MGLFGKKNAAALAASQPKNTLETVVEYVQALLGAIVLAILIRGFVFEPFKIPSESMVPTLLVGDHIFVKRYAYGLRLPFTKKWLAEFSDPKRGDVVVFSFPEDESIDFIKRVIGVPGDTVAMHKGVLFVNGKEVEEQDVELLRNDADNKCWMDMSNEAEAAVPDKIKPYPYYRGVEEFQPKVETLDNGVQHYAQRSKKIPLESDFENVVPPRHFFVLGDNRDESQDSRFWGFVPRENLKGRALYIWLSLNSEGIKCPGDFGFLHIRWDRFGRKII